MVKIKESNKKNLQSLARKRNLAREELQKVLTENEREWKFATKVLRKCEDDFVELWNAYKTDRNYIEHKFFACCESLTRFTAEERRADREFRKTYKPYYDKVQKITKEYNYLKSLQSKKRGKRK